MTDAQPIVQRPAPPGSEEELLDNARRIAGLRIGQLASALQLPLATDQLHHKGEVGEILEHALGASAASLPEPDFQLIGVELKTIPVKANGQPCESTYVCMVPLGQYAGEDWQSSVVCHKLSRVLWVPIEADRHIPLADRRIGSALLWSPSTEQAHTLRTDWEELMEKVSLGELDEISSRHGVALQIRPKAANSRVLTDTIDANGERSQTLPRGFYLRPSFTREILQSHYHL